MVPLGPGRLMQESWRLGAKGRVLLHDYSNPNNFRRQATRTKGATLNAEGFAYSMWGSCLGRMEARGGSYGTLS